MSSALQVFDRKANKIPAALQDSAVILLTPQCLLVLEMMLQETNVAQARDS